jgi:hypothetical protein
MDANIKLTAEGGEATQMTLTAVYRPPLGALGAGLDRVLLHKVAAATVRSLMINTARALEGTATVPGAAGTPMWWVNGPEVAF